MKSPQDEVISDRDLSGHLGLYRLDWYDRDLSNILKVELK